ncbi:polysaccharide biosynthesis protein [Pedobacter sp. L105]|uniref:polysaccharide biosynthesis protein n=1 Tax=Pedobacter sp. L105 TaxID=1641871 RepID=UPI00131D7D15|nr:polysaccharide biosynthesis protein [Pedobacter sp. L105]
MRAFINKLSTDPKYARAYQWGKLISVTGSAQMLVQGLGLISGIIIIRLVSTPEYALYTLANTMLGTITALADGGITNGVLSSGAKVWRDKDELGSVVATGIALRQKFAVGSLAISLPILFYLLIKHQAGWLTALTIAVALIPAFYAQLTDSLLEVPVKLNQDIVALQKNQIWANILRFVMIAGGLFFLPFTAIAVLANGIPRIWANIKLRIITGKFANLNAAPNPAVKKDILFMVKRTLPGTIYYCISGQITIWLISVYGSTSSIAQIGALGRLTTLLTILTTLFATLIIPRFARLPEERKPLLTRFLQVFFILAVLSAVISGMVYLFPHQVLFILGKGYSNLNKEVVLSTLSGCISMVVGIIYSLLVSRGWIISPLISITLSILVQVLLITFFDLSNTTNVLIYSIINATFGLCMYFVYFAYRIIKLKPNALPQI